MAKSVSAKSAARTLRQSGSSTFIQRSRGVSSVEKATVHNITGAGKSRVIRRFFDLTEDDQDAAARIVEQAVLGGQ